MVKIAYPTLWQTVGKAYSLSKTHLVLINNEDKQRKHNATDTQFIFRSHRTNPEGMKLDMNYIQSFALHLRLDYINRIGKKLILGTFPSP